MLPKCYVLQPHSFLCSIPVTRHKFLKHLAVESSISYGNIMDKEQQEVNTMQDVRSTVMKADSWSLYVLTTIIFPTCSRQMCESTLKLAVPFIMPC